MIFCQLNLDAFTLGFELEFRVKKPPQLGTEEEKIHWVDPILRTVFKEGCDAFGKQGLRNTAEKWKQWLQSEPV